MLKKNRKKKSNWRYHHFAPVYLQSWWYDLQFLRYKVWQTEFGNYRSFFALPPTNNLKNQNFEKTKKMAGDIIILHMCAENHDHKKYSSRDTERDRQDFLSFWAIFCSSTPLTTQKMKILKKRNKYLEVWSFYTCAPKTMIIWCMFLEIWSASDKKFCRFGPFFALLPHYWPWKLKFGKNMVKNTWRYYPFANVYH